MGVYLLTGKKWKIDKIKGRYLLENYCSWKQFLIFWYVFLYFYLIHLLKIEIIRWIQFSLPIHHLVFTDYYFNSLKILWKFSQSILLWRTTIIYLTSSTEDARDEFWKMWEYFKNGKGIQGLGCQLCINIHCPGLLPKNHNCSCSVFMVDCLIWVWTESLGSLDHVSFSREEDQT